MTIGATEDRMLAQAAGSYRERPVEGVLQDHFACVWPDVQPVVVVPDGCIDLEWIDGALRIAGPDRAPKIERLAAGATVVGFRFRPAVAAAWLGLPASETVDRRIPGPRLVSRCIFPDDEPLCFKERGLAMHRKLALGLSTLLLAFAMVATGAAAQELKKVRLIHALPQLSASFANDSSLPAFLGFWKAEGLDVEVLTSPGAAAAMQLVAGKQAEIGVVNAFSSMLARQRGARVKSYYTSLRGDIFGIAIPKDTGLKTLADLKGKTIGVSSFASGGSTYARSLLSSAGLDPAKDFTMIEIGVGGRAAAAVKSSQVQGLALWDEMYVRMDQAGISLSERIQDPRAKYTFASNLTVNDDDFARIEAVLIGVARGIAKAQVFSEQNPEAAVRIHWKVFPQSAPREGVTDAAVKQEAEILKVRVQMQSQNAVGTNRYGDIPLDQIKQVEDYLVATKQLEKTMDPNEYYSNGLIEKVNEFDHAAIVKLAKEYKVP